MSNENSQKRLFSWIRGGVIESFFRHAATAIPYRKTMGFLLGFITSLLLLTSWTDTGGKPITESTAAWAFAVLVGAVFLLLVLVRPNDKGALDRFTWGILVMVVLGFGAGALTFHYRDTFYWVWTQARWINSSKRVILSSLFLLGVILGFFVVRNWAKEQKDFVASLTAVFGGTFVASIVGKVDGGPALVDSLAAYAVGFTLSGTINLIVAARLTASYTNRKTIASRAILDFLYGSERTILIDGYFLKNFKDDPDYAKAWLVDALIEFAKFAKLRFADRMEQRRKDRILRWRQPCFAAFDACNRKISEKKIDLQRATKDKKAEIASEIEHLEQKCKPLEKAYNDLQGIDEQIIAAREKLQCAVVGAEERAKIEANINDLITKGEASKKVCQDFAESDQAGADACSNGLSYYQLLAVECEGEADLTSSLTDKHTIFYRPIDQITAEMFRISVSVRWQDALEYIVAPGEYKGTFPVVGSVSGLALLMRKTIVMYRDRYKLFRSKDYARGTYPERTQQGRGLDSIDFLSYVSIPVVSRLGRSTENGVGVLGIDTRIFLATNRELAEQRQQVEPGVLSATVKDADLHTYANRLYEQEDKDIQYLEEITKIVVPVLELYLKCRIGAT